MAKLKTGRHTSAIKAWRKSEKRAARNRGVKAGIKGLVKEYKAALAKGDEGAAAKIMAKIDSALDKASRKGVLHHKTSARKKSRLATLLKSCKPA